VDCVPAQQARLRRHLARPARCGSRDMARVRWPAAACRNSVRGAPRRRMARHASRGGRARRHGCRTVGPAAVVQRTHDTQVAPRGNARCRVAVARPPALAAAWRHHGRAGAGADALRRAAARARLRSPDGARGGNGVDVRRRDVRGGWRFTDRRASGTARRAGRRRTPRGVSRPAPLRGDVGHDVVHRRHHRRRIRRCTWRIHGRDGGRTDRRGNRAGRMRRTARAGGGLRDARGRRRHVVTAGRCTPPR